MTETRDLLIPCDHAPLCPVCERCSMHHASWCDRQPVEILCRVCGNPLVPCGRPGANHMHHQYGECLR